MLACPSRPSCALGEREATQGARATSGATRAEAPDAPPAAHRGDLAALLPPWGLSLSGLVRAGDLRAHGHPSGGPWRQVHWTACNGYFLEPYGTIFHGKQAPVELIVRVLACLAEGLGIRATARGFEVAPHTVRSWLVEAAEQLRAFCAYFLCDLHVKPRQLDEVYAGLRGLKAGASSANEALKRLERSRYWGWTALDPTSKLLGVIEVGTRTLAMAQRAVPQVTRGLVRAASRSCSLLGAKRIGRQS